MSRVRISRLGAIALTFALVAAACGDDDDDDTAATTTTAAAATSTTAAAATTTAAPEETTTTIAAPTGEPIKLMTIYVKTGAGATPELAEGAIAAAEAINRAGGIDGRPVEIIECDAGQDPNQAADCGRQAVDEGVVAVVGALSANSGEYLPALEAAKIPAVGVVPASAADFTNAASYPIYGGLVTAAGGLAAGLVAKGATKVSIARVDLAAAAAIGIFANAALKNSGLAVVNDVAIPAGAPDMAAYVASATQGGTDGILVGLFGQDATNFIIQLRQTAPDVRIAATTTEFAAVIDAIGEASDGIVVLEFFYDVASGNEAAEQYVADLEAAGYEESTGFRTNSYASVKVVEAVLALAPEISASALWDTLPTVEGLDIGIMPKLQFKTGGVGGIPRIFNGCTQFAELKDGESVAFGDGFIDPFTGAAC